MVDSGDANYVLMVVCAEAWSGLVRVDAPAGRKTGRQRVLKINAE